MPATTADCKKFLVEFFTRYPALIVNIYGEEALSKDNLKSLLQDARNHNKWKREFKSNAATYFHEHTSFVTKTSAGLTVQIFPEGKSRPMPLADIATVRTLVLDPNEYDSAVCFLVLEAKDGTLHLGEYAGD